MSSDPLRAVFAFFHFSFHQLPFFLSIYSGLSLHFRALLALRFPLLSSRFSHFLRSEPDILPLPILPFTPERVPAAVRA